MGRLEKIVVLTVLFLVAMILGVSLNQGGDPLEPAPEGTLAQAPQESATGLDQQAPVDPVASEGPVASDGPQGTLFTGVREETEEPPAPALDPEPVEQPAVSTANQQVPADASPEPIVQEPSPAPKPPSPKGPELLTTEGLTAGLMPDVMIYTWTEGDSFQALAERYFGTNLEVGRLRKANEGRDEASLRAGDRIFVPVRAGEPTERLTRSESSAGQWNGGVYRVEPGDMLGRIAQKVYGSASKWRVIYEANRDVLASPDALQVGMALRIPRID